MATKTTTKKLSIYMSDRTDIHRTIKRTTYRACYITNTGKMDARQYIICGSESDNIRRARPYMSAKCRNGEKLIHCEIIKVTTDDRVMSLEVFDSHSKKDTSKTKVTENVNLKPTVTQTTETED